MRRRPGKLGHRWTRVAYSQCWWRTGTKTMLSERCSSSMELSRENIYTRAWAAVLISDDVWVIFSGVDKRPVVKINFHYARILKWSHFYAVFKIWGPIPYFIGIFYSRSSTYVVRTMIHTYLIADCVSCDCRSAKCAGVAGTCRESEPERNVRARLSSQWSTSTHSHVDTQC